jgi:GT2 family glycosyltransferase
LLILEFTYSRTSSPSSIGTDKLDQRSLAVAYHSICLATTKNKEIIDFKESSKHLIFGFYSSELWGAWSAGKKSCIQLPDFDPHESDILVSLEAQAFREAFRSCKVKIKTSSGHYGIVKISDRRKYKLRLKKPFIYQRRRLIVGCFSKIYSQNNCSYQKKNPLVSIIVLNQEKSYLSRLSVTAAASSGCKLPFEILCVDNGSSAHDLEYLHQSEVPFRVIKLEENKGFSRANNLAAHEARGDYLLFLNNDAFLDAGSLDEMLMTFKKIPDCRIVGSVLRFPDGTMQEAGASIQANGHTIRHGRYDSKFKPRKLPRFMPVDYVSGACMMIRKSDFISMGGFDEKYSPAYYEDTDLCMRTLLYGQKVYLASRANCFHIENATTSTIEDGAWATRTAEAHREIFLKDWGAYLASRDAKDLPWHLKR